MTTAFLSLMLICSVSAGTPTTTTTANDAVPTYDIRAGPVAHAFVQAVSGTFQSVQVRTPDAIPSALLGGACLVFPASDLGFTTMAAKECSKNSDCSTVGENAVGYCDTSTKQCWSRPNHATARADLCNLGFTLAPQEIYQVPAAPVDVSTKFNIQAGAKVRVIACLNRVDADLRVDGCGSADGPKRIEVMGPVATIRVSPNP